MLNIKGIYIRKGCKYIKCLQEDTYYSLESKMPEDFFAPNVCFTTIVGQNGAGKSSLLDILFRILNNIGYCLYGHVERNAADDMSYVLGLYADLYYKLNGADGVLHCRNRAIALEYGNKKVKFAVRHHKGHKLVRDELEFEGYEDYTHPDFPKMKEIAKIFFYTIATNYSLQAYISQDYKDEPTVSYSEQEQANVPGESIWMDNLFHKNDGYMCPLVLNPFRDKGKIDMANEEHLTTQRLEAILIEEDENHPFMEGYCYDHITYNLNPRTIQYGFRNIIGNSRMYFSEEEIEEQNENIALEEDRKKYIKNEDLEDFKRVALDPNSYAHAILAALFCGVKEGMTTVELALREYVVYKVLNIAEKYPSYSHYGKYLFTNSLFCSAPAEDRQNTLQMAKDLARADKGNKSHIGLKLNQALHFIYSTKRFSQEQWKRLEEPFTYTEYCQILNITEKGMSVAKRMSYLPPTIFHPEVHVKKTGAEKSMTINQLSSGERQLFFTLSTLVYHIQNLRSIPTNGSRVRYGNVCLVLDEVEICFHPDYQRTFVKRFLDTVSSMQLNHAFGIHVIITTHSPFLLSDIPLENILSLDDGEPKKMALRNTFCANVYDLLNNPFFMQQFIGDFASEKLDKLVEEVNQEGGLDEAAYENLKAKVEMIGDDFVHDRLLEKLSERYSKLAILRNRERELNEELQRVKRDIELELQNQ